MYVAGTLRLHAVHEAQPTYDRIICHGPHIIEVGCLKDWGPSGLGIQYAPRTSTFQAVARNIVGIATYPHMYTELRVSESQTSTLLANHTGYKNTPLRPLCILRHHKMQQVHRTVRQNQNTPTPHHPHHYNAHNHRPEQTKSRIIPTGTLQHPPPPE